MSSTTDRSQSRGQVLVLFAGGLAALMLVAALAFDVGMMLAERRDEQNAADAAALAGARYLSPDPALSNEPAARAAARAIALANGYDDAHADQIVLIHIPPIHGPFAARPGMIEVQIENTRQSIFGGIIGRSVWPVGASAIATNAQNLTFPFSMLALNPTECKAIAVSGGGTIEAYANIQSNSNGTDCAPGDPVGFSRTGGATINVVAPDATCRVVGDFQDRGSGPPITCTIARNSFALPDPLRNLPAPVMPPLAPPMQFVGDPADEPADQPKACPGRDDTDAPNPDNPSMCVLGNPSSTYADLEWILYPGLYPGGLGVNAGTTAYLMPGIYWIGGGGVDVGGGGSIFTIGTETDANTDVTLATWGGGVMIYNSKLPAELGGPFILNSNAATMKLRPLNVSTSDPDHIYNSIVIFQDRTVAAPLTLNGSASSTEVLGIIYAPAAQIKLLGNGGTLVVDQVIADTYDIRGDDGTIRVMRGTGVDAVLVAAGLVE